MKQSMTELEDFGFGRRDRYRRTMPRVFGLVSVLSDNQCVATIYLKPDRKKRYSVFERRTFQSALQAREWFDHEWPSMAYVVVDNFVLPSR